MELKLYKHIKSHLDKKNIDITNNKSILIESFSEETGLDMSVLDNIKNYLREYNKYIKSISANEEIKLRYYQIMALYFTEYYFEHKNDEALTTFSQNSLAYWMATGSGKTIIMHLNILQYLSKLKKFDKLQIILTTPGVNLIEQHRRELIPFIDYLNKNHNNKIELMIDTTSSFLNKPNDYFNMLDTHKHQRLILVDEAHIGVGSKEEGEFKKFRDKINMKNSFLLEYSATFYNLSGNTQNEYENSIIYDYNYNLFFKDGYGKDYFIKKVSLNIEDKPKDNLDECFRIVQEKMAIHKNFKTYQAGQISLSGKRFPDKPLIAFMGNTVNNKKDEGKNDEVSDIASVIYYLADLNAEERIKYQNVFNGDINGQLTITRNKNVEDEILLSFGDGEYWGIVNIGNGDKFIKEIEHEKIIKKPSVSILAEKYLFKNIDSKDSTINVLIGSRKFAEGWNCFRVSVIGLINLGSSKGNKIIQIFGRGVRLKGLCNNGKRNYANHVEDYYSLKEKNEENDIRKLETLCVLSLKDTYIEKFTQEIEKQIEHTFSFEIPVTPKILNIKDDNEVEFDEYAKKLSIFKIRKVESGYKKVILDKDKVTYFFNGKENQINNFKFNLDYRADKSIAENNIKNKLKNFIKDNIYYLDNITFSELIYDLEKEILIQIYVKEKNNLREFNVLDIFYFIDQLIYKDIDDNLNIEIVQKFILKIIEDFMKKLKNKINYNINSKNYIFNEKLVQQTEENKGDFMCKYVVTKKFETLMEKEEFISQYEANKEMAATEIEDLKVKPEANYHIYTPLLEEVEREDLKVSPDILNTGEVKFVKDICEYVDEKFQNDSIYEFYLMRNVESLKSIGIYLENDGGEFYPDFILWIVDTQSEITYINFIDPKGQSGIDNKKINAYNDKVTIALKDEKSILTYLENKMNNSDNKVVINSFILLRDTSDLGKDQDIQWIKDNMLKYNILRLDWHKYKEKDRSNANEDNLLEGKNYIDKMFEKIGIQINN